MVLATVIDITERLRAEEEIRRQNTDLRRLNEELGQFAYSASHDLKAPLATLEGILLCLQDDLDACDVTAAHDNSAKARKLANRLATLIEGILGFARSENLHPELVEVALHGLVDGMAADLDALFTGRGVELRNEVPEGLRFMVDQRRLSQVMENLLTNGAKFSNRDAKQSSVTVRAWFDDGHVVISVADNGIGFPAGSEDQVFAMFRRFGNHDEEGTGLGLALVKQNMDHLGGVVTYESGADGTTFELRLPVGAEIEALDEPMELQTR